MSSRLSHVARGMGATFTRRSLFNVHQHRVLQHCQHRALSSVYSRGLPLMCNNRGNSNIRRAFSSSNVREVLSSDTCSQYYHQKLDCYIYLVGMNAKEKTSPEQVETVITKVAPQTVILELDENRFQTFKTLDEESQKKTSKEYHVAIKAADKIGATIVEGDMALSQMFGRVVLTMLNPLNWVQIVKGAVMDTTFRDEFQKTQENTTISSRERTRRLNELLSKYVPSLYQLFILDRSQHMFENILQQSETSNVVVCVVSLGHMDVLERLIVESDDAEEGSEDEGGD